MRDIGKNIRDIRLHAGFTQEELAEKLFVTRQTISNYETGKTRPDVDTIVRIGELLNADANAVIYGIPADLDKRKKYRRILILTGIVLILGIFMMWLNGAVTQYRNQSYKSFLYTLVKLICIPSAWVLTGWWLSDVLSVFLKFEPWNHKYIRCIRIGVLCALVISFLLLIPQLIFDTICDFKSLTEDSFSLSFPYIPVFSDLARFTVINTYRYPLFYSLFGTLLGILGFPKRNKE